MISSANISAGLSAVQVLMSAAANSDSSAGSTDGKVASTGTAGRSGASASDPLKAIQSILMQVQVAKIALPSGVLSVYSEGGATSDSELGDGGVYTSDGLTIANYSSGTISVDYFDVGLSLNGLSESFKMEADGASAPVQSTTQPYEFNVGNGNYQDFFVFDMNSGNVGAQKLLDITGLNQTQAKQMYEDVAGGFSNVDASVSAWTPPPASAATSLLVVASNSAKSA